MFELYRGRCNKKRSAGMTDSISDAGNDAKEAGKLFRVLQHFIAYDGTVSVFIEAMNDPQERRRRLNTLGFHNKRARKNIRETKKQQRKEAQEKLLIETLQDLDEEIFRS